MFTYEQTSYNLYSPARRVNLDASLPKVSVSIETYPYGDKTIQNNSAQPYYPSFNLTTLSIMTF